MPSNRRAQRVGDNDKVVTNAIKGALAGAAAVWAMDRIDWFMFNRQDPNTRRRTQRARPGGLDPAHVAAKKLAETTNTKLSPAQPNLMGVGIHYDLGIVPGALYGILQDRVPALGKARGLLWGLGLYLVQDQMLNTALGLSGRPGKYPWQAHARGLIAHLVYGVALEASMRALRAAPSAAMDPSRLPASVQEEIPEAKRAPAVPQVH